MKHLEPLDGWVEQRHFYAMAYRTIVYLAAPRMTRSFDVQVAAEDAASGELVGADLSAVALFLRISSGIPRFDLETGGRLFGECRLSSLHAKDSIPFTFETVRAIGEPSDSTSGGPSKASL